MGLGLGEGGGGSCSGGAERAVGELEIFRWPVRQQAESPPTSAPLLHVGSLCAALRRCYEVC